MKRDPQWFGGVGWLCTDEDCDCRTKEYGATGAMCLACWGVHILDQMERYSRGQIIVCPMPSGNPYSNAWRAVWREAHSRWGDRWRDAIDERREAREIADKGRREHRKACREAERNYEASR